MVALDKLDIVAVDDDVGIRWTLEHIFDLGGYNYQITGDCLEGLQLIQKHNPSVVLLDYRIGAMSGMDVLKGIQEMAVECKVLFLSGYACDLRSEVCDAPEVAGVIDKPFDVDNLLAEIDSILHR